MTRTMIDATHDDLMDPTAWPAIRALAPGNGVAFYDTGSPDIAATPQDIAAVPRGLFLAMIDQGFTGSPNLRATVRDCEQGAWTLDQAVNRAGWNVPRPTLYLGYPDTAIQAFNAGWRGDVWLVGPSNVAPVKPPSVPTGLNVVAVQWKYTGSWDQSVVFDPTWPADPTPPPPPVKDKKMYLVHVTGHPEVFLWNGTDMSHVFSVEEELQWKNAGVPSVLVSAAGFGLLKGAPALP